MREPYILYDAHCKLCCRSVRWISRNDARRRFSFQALQLRDHPSLVLMLNGNRYERSSAVLRIAVRLCFPWPLLGIFFLVPPKIRDSIYDLVARNRKQWFGEAPECSIP